VPTIFAANESRVLVNGNAVEGVRSLAYRRAQVRESVYAVGSAERVGVVSGAAIFEGQLRVASTAQPLDELAADKSFQISAVLSHADARMTVTLDECYLQEKTFDMAVGGHGESVYSFTATRAREERG
jgi:hypothetical protein